MTLTHFPDLLFAFCNFCCFLRVQKIWAESWLTISESFKVDCVRRPLSLSLWKATFRNSSRSHFPDFIPPLNFPRSNDGRVGQDIFILTRDRWLFSRSSHMTREQFLPLYLMIGLKAAEENNKSDKKQIVLIANQDLSQAFLGRECFPQSFNCFLTLSGKQRIPLFPSILRHPQMHVSQLGLVFFLPKSLSISWNPFDGVPIFCSKSELSLGNRLWAI